MPNASGQQLLLLNNDCIVHDGLAGTHAAARLIASRGRHGRRQDIPVAAELDSSLSNPVTRLSADLESAPPKWPVQAHVQDLDGGVRNELVKLRVLR